MKDFTSQQKEVVARKLGYDGPMQGFDEFLASSPSLEAKYASITGKFSQRMANGGLVKMKPRGYPAGGYVTTEAPKYTDDQIASWWSNPANQALSDVQIKELMLQEGVSPEQFARAIGANEATAVDISSRYETAPANQYFANNSDVADEFEANTYGMSAADYAAFHYNNYGFNEGRTPPTGVAYKPPTVTAPPTTAPPVTTTPAPTTTVPRTTVPGTTLPITTRPVTTVPPTTLPITTRPITTAPITTRPITTAPLTTIPGTTRAPGVTLSPAEQAAAIATRTAATQTSSPVTYSATGVPQAADAAQVATIATIGSTEAQKIGTDERAGTVETITGTTPAAATLASVPTTTPAVTMSATTAATPLKTELDKVSSATGTLTADATVAAEELWTTALTAAREKVPQIDTAQKVAVVPERTLLTGETLAGSAVDMTKVGTELAKAEAAQGTVTEDMTVQGQLAKLTSNFDATNPPPWAAGALRAVTAEMAARGLGASSLAGAALVQAAMEKALPIASADAAIYQQFASQNLSNKQQIAVLTAQQRATFLGQEFDQNFQTRVINAARVSEIANLNFNAKQQVALENARLAQSVDLANLSSRQAAFMAELAQTATLETASLNNRQQAAVVNAQSALQIDLTNMSYEQQTTVLKTQLTAQAILSDAAADNAAKQFNATSTNQTNQFFATLSSQVSQFNSAQSNGMEQFKVDQANSVKKFNAEVTNQREQFNAQQRLVIDQSNAQWQREISTANTAATNLINLQNAQLSQQMSLTEYNNEIQMYRDAVTHAWQSAENDANRATTLAASEISAAAAIQGANIKADGDSSAAIGAFVARVLIG
jgi:hypothetical protein